MLGIIRILMIRRLENNPNKRNISFSQSETAVSRIIKRIPISELKYGLKGDYYKGDVLFTYNDDWLAESIAYFTRKERKSNLKTTHVAIIADENTCIETRDTTLAITDMKKKYFDDEKFRLYIRKPKEMTEEIKDEFIQNAQKAIGTRYARVLLFMMALRNSNAGTLIDKFSNYKYFDWMFDFCEGVSSKLYKKGTVTCSQHLASAFKMCKNWELHDQGILKRPSNSISPQKTIEAEELFEPTIIQVR